MKIDLKIFILGFFIALVIGYFISSYFNTECYVESIFSPNSDVKILNLINTAQESIDIQMYVFSNYELQEALINAQKRGVKVRVILEQEIESNEDCFYNLVSNDIEVRWAPRTFSRTHSKFMIIDGKKVFVGSTNFSYHAVTSNREAAVLTSCAVKDFIEVFESDWNFA